MLIADRVISAMEGILHMAKNGVEPLEHFAIGILAPIVRDDRLLAALGLGNSGKTMQAITDQRKTSRMHCRRFMRTSF